MKKLLIFLLLISVSYKSFCQTSNVVYFGGIYDNQIYFNFVIHNKDTCYYIVEMSKDGREYQEIFCDSIKPMPCAILHGVRIPTNETDVCVRITIETQGKIIWFQPESFHAEQYTYAPKVSIAKARPIHATF